MRVCAVVLCFPCPAIDGPIVANNTANQANLLSRMTGRIVGMIARRPRLFMWPVLILACAAAGITVSDLRLQTGRDALVDPAADFSQTWTQYTQDFASHGDLVVVVETATPDRPLIQATIDHIGERLKSEPEYFRDVLYRIDKRKLRPKSLQLLSPSELRVASRRVGEYSTAVRQQQWDQIRVTSMSKKLRQKFASYRREGLPETSLLREADRLASSLDRFVDGTVQGVRYKSSTFPSPWEKLVPTEFETAAEDADLAYLMTNEFTQGMLKAVVVPHEAALDPNSPSIHRLREICDEVQAKYTDTGAKLRVMVTGIPVLEHDELSRAGRDMLLAALLAMVLVGGMLSFGFRSLRHPMLILLTLIVALSCTFGVATLAIGHLNILSICFAAVLIGLGVDFGVHFLSRYLHIRQENPQVDDALQQTGLEAGSGIITSALTTALAFGSAALTGFPGLAELGIIAGSGILISAACTFGFLPALIAISDAGSTAEQLPQPFAGRLFRRIVAGVPLIMLAVSLLAILGVGSRAVDWNSGQPELRLSYDANLLNLQDPELDSVKAQQVLWENANESLLYAVATAGSQQEATQLATSLSQLPTVSHVSELASLLSGNLTPEQQQGIVQLRSQVAGVSTSVPAFGAIPPSQVGRELDALYKTVKASSDPRAQVPAARLDRFLDRMEAMSPQQRSAVLDAYQNLLAGSLLYQFERVARASSLEQIEASDLPASWANRLYSEVDGAPQYLIKIYPKHNIWNAVELDAFVQDVRSVSSNVTGIPIQNYESSRQLQASWSSITIYSLAAISLFLLLEFLRPGQKALTLITPMLITGFIGYTMHTRTGEVNPHLMIGIYVAMVVFIALVVDFRNLRDTFIAILPPVAGAALMAGAMAIFHVDLNPLNLVVLPLILGIGVDDGIHIVHDYRRQVARGSRSYVPSGETVTGVILTSLTTAVGFGSLLIAGHQGLVSVGLVMVLGVTSCMLVALVPLPALLTLVARHQPPSMEPLVMRKPKAAKQKTAAPASDEADSAYDDDDDDGTRPMTRREKRRLSRAA
jgi:predicted RND superfamily exporter protein